MNKHILFSKLITNALVIFFVVIWIVPTLGLFVSSLRDKDQLATSGWWTALVDSSQQLMYRTPNPLELQQQENGQFVLRGNIFTDKTQGEITHFGASSLKPDAFTAGTVATLKKEQTMQVLANGDYRITSPVKFTSKRGIRIFYTALMPPTFTIRNYQEVIGSQGIGQSFINSLTVTIPSTIIPILIAAFAAYALAWMPFWGKRLMMIALVGLLVVPLQMSLIPLLKLYTSIGQFFGIDAKSYPGIWLAHSAFGLPMAIFLLFNYFASLPREIIESARVDGATDFYIFRKIILPLSFPALASFAIFQFLWVWNDLLISMVFLNNNDEQLVLTGRLRELLGSLGGNWEILTASAFISIIVPLIVFFGLQKYLVRGMLAGSVK